jgi:hypothetical protein
MITTLLLPFKFFNLGFKSLIVISSWFACYYCLVLKAFLVLYKYKKNKTAADACLKCISRSGGYNRNSFASFDSSWRHLPFWVVHVWWFGVIRPKIVVLFSFLFLFRIACCHAINHINPSIYFFL